MNVEINPTVRDAITFLRANYPTMQVNEHVAAAWQMACGAYTPEQMQAGLAMLVRTHRHGAPVPASLIACIEGELKTVQVPRLDLHNRVMLNGPGGAPLTDPKPMRVWPDGTTAPADEPRHPALPAASRAHRIEAPRVPAASRHGAAHIADDLSAFLDPA